MKRIKFSELVKFTDRQLSAYEATNGYKFILYGGALGGGKSYFLRWLSIRRHLDLAKRGFRGVCSMLACEDYPALKDRQISKIATEFPPWLGKIHSEHKAYGRCFILDPEYGGGVICLRNLDDPSKYQSAEFAFICVDELTKNGYDVFVHLKSRLRWVGIPDEETIFIGATNPGGIGHAWCKQLWLDKDFPQEWTTPKDYRPSFVYIPSKATDNPHLDSAYWAQLQTLPENLRKAFRDGDWNIFVGQAFPNFSNQIHVTKPRPIPESAPIYMTYDWGFGKPFSLGWWWVDSDGSIYRFHEWYGWSGTADEGLRLADTDVALGINKIEAELGLTGRYITRLSGHDCFQKRPDYKGGGQGPSTAEVFAGYGILLVVGDPSRNLKIRQFRERLRVDPDLGRPSLFVYDTCKQFIRTIPNLIMDKNNVEDIDTDGEDHIYDESCLICQARPMKMPGAPPAIPTQAQIDHANFTGIPLTHNQGGDYHPINLDGEDSGRAINVE